MIKALFVSSGEEFIFTDALEAAYKTGVSATVIRDLVANNPFKCVKGWKFSKVRQ